MTIRDRNRGPWYRSHWSIVLLGWLASVAPVLAQQSGEKRVVTGRVLETGGAPIPAAAVRVTTSPGGALRTSQSDSTGRYTLTLPAGGERYELRAERVGFYGLTVDLHPQPGQRRIVRDLRLTSRAVALAPIEARAARPTNRPPAARTPGGQDEAGLSAFTGELPLTPGDLAGIAALRPGVIRLGEEGGISIGGQSPSQNSITLDGASFGGLSLPAEALRTTAVVTSTFDPSRGQFSGGQIAATTLSGTNLFGGAARVRFGHPALQAGGTAGPVSGSEYRLLQFDGGAGGALVRNRFFWYGALQATRRASPLITLQNADSALLLSLGVSPDSVRRLSDLVHRSGHGLEPAPVPDARHSDAGTALLRLDYQLGDDHVLMARLDGRGTRLQGVGESPLALPGGGGELRDVSGGLLVQITSYRGGSRNELRAYHSEGSRSSIPYLTGPGATVRVTSALADSSAGSALLRFGGSALAPVGSETWLWEISDELVVPLDSKGNRAKVGFIVNRERVVQNGTPEASGSFTFNSLADVEAGRPAAFTRTLGEQPGEAVADYLALYGGHLWSPVRNLSLIYGLRLEGRRYPGPRTTRTEADLPWELQTGSLPSEWGVSPRAGFAYDAESRAWSIRGGFGEFRGRLPMTPLAAALAETGTLAERQVVCVGPAAPVPDWPLYATDPKSLPRACAGGAPLFGSRAPRATRFAPDFGAPRTWRGTLSWNWSGTLPRLGMLGLNVEGSAIHGVSQPVAWDRNLNDVPGFELGEEAGRQIYVSPSQIDPATGGIAPEASRLVSVLSTVREVSSRGRSTVGQLSVGASLLSRRMDLIFGSYTLTRAWDQVGSVAAPGGVSEPVAAAEARALVTAASDLERRHLFQLRWNRPVYPWPGEIGVVGRLTSGAPYTPRVSADVNGDGLANDAAFVFDPATARDSAVAADMGRLLATAPDATRDCLSEQLGRVAERNSCRAPWTAELDVQANFWPGQDRRSRRFTISFVATNTLAGLDRLVHGAAGMRGWGQAAYPDATLLYPRGFDLEGRAFRYAVNPDFGARPPSRSVLRRPFTLTIQGRWTFGADPIRQPLLSMFNSIRAQGRTPEQLRVELARTIPNLPAQVLGLDDTLHLRLSPAQQVQLRAAADSLGRTLASLTESLAEAISVAETTTDRDKEHAAREQVNALAQEAQTALDAVSRILRQILSGEQWRRLPAAIQQPSRQILPPRGGFTVQTGEVW